METNLLDEATRPTVSDTLVDVEVLFAEARARGRRRRIRLGALVIAALLMAGLALTVGLASLASAKPVDMGRDVHLEVSTDTSGIGFQALMTNGHLHLNDRGCLMLGDTMLRATAGSALSPDGTSVYLEGYGTFDVPGTLPSAGGGNIPTDTSSAFFDRCGGDDYWALG